MSIALFVDGYFAYMCYQPRKLDFLKLRTHLEDDLDDVIDEAYYFCSEPKDDGVRRFFNALTLPPPKGPGFRVKKYWTRDMELSWPAKLGGKKVAHPELGVPYIQTQQKAVDVGLAYHLGRSFSNRKWDKLVLFAGDADFYEPVQHLVEFENVDLFLVGTLRKISEYLRGHARKIYCVDEEPLNEMLEWAPGSS